jgi:hypothetical protein
MSAQIERLLEDQYVPTLQLLGLSRAAAQQAFAKMIELARLQSKQEGTDKFQVGFGDYLVERATSGGEVPSIVKKLRREGVNDEDIRWWWNMHDLERRMMLLVDDMSRTAVMMEAMNDKGQSRERGAASVRTMFPIFGDPDDTRHAQGDDRPLPFELKERINVYIERRAREDSSSLKCDIAKHTTVNALVRHEIRCGNL